MKLVKKIMDLVAQIATYIVILMILGMVGMIVAELLNRNLLNRSFRASIEVCGILFLWMAFFGLIPLYNENGLMRLDFIVTRAKGVVAEILFFINQAFSFLLGSVMVVAYAAQYPFVSSRFYATIPGLPYTIQYFPMAVAGAFIALKTVQQIVERIFDYGHKPSASANQ